MIVFAILGVWALAAGVAVVVARNPVHSALWLIAHLVAVALLFLTLQAEFLALIQILVYAGAVMVLFLFVVGMLQVGKDPEQLGADRLRSQVWMACGSVALLAAGLVVAAAAAPQAAQPVAPGFGSVAAFGDLLFGPQVLPFEATALVLLIAIVGAVALAREEARGR